MIHALSRQAIAERIHDLVLIELGEDVDVSLLLGPAEYARAVLSLCRSFGSAELVRLAEAFLSASDEDQQRQRAQQITRYVDGRPPSPADATAPSTRTPPAAMLSYAASAVLAKANC